MVYIIAADDRCSYELCHSNLLPSDSKRTPISGVTMTSAHYVIDQTSVILRSCKLWDVILALYLGG